MSAPEDFPAEIEGLTLQAASERIHSGEITPADVTRAVLRRIDEIEPQILAWARLCPEQALADAERLTQMLREGRDLGPLHGIPIGVKDVYHTAGIETSAGSSILKGFVPERDAEAVKNLRSAGAIILGKTITTEFAFLDPAPTRNPRNLDYTPGGPSSGSAAAVAASMCYGALGTQTGGSILRPAAYCGIVGLKPTCDLISREGIIPLAWSLDHAGLLARTVADAALLLEGMVNGVSFHAAALFGGSPAEGLGQFTVGIPDRYFLEKADDETKVAFFGAMDALLGLGLKVCAVRLPASFEEGVEAGSLTFRVEAAAFHEEWFRSRRGEYPPKLAELVEAGLSVSVTAYARAQQTRRAATAQMRECFRRVDFIVTPATPAAAPKGLSSTGDYTFNSPFSTFGLPALSVPMGAAANGLPLGLQLVAGHFREEALLRLGMAFEAVSPPHLPAKLDT